MGFGDESARVAAVVRWFGLVEERRGVEVSAAAREGAEVVMGMIGAGKVVLVTGASGSGKSSVLREVKSRLGRRCVDVDRIRLADRACVDCLGRGSVEEVLGELGRLGLGEAWTYVLHPKELSEGQRWRLKLAVGLRRARGRRMKDEGGRMNSECAACGVIVADEFGAVLDRVTAKVVARCLRRAVGQTGVCAVLATSHEDLGEALSADGVVRCDYGEVEVVSC